MGRVCTAIYSSSTGEGDIAWAAVLKRPIGWSAVEVGAVGDAG